MLLSNEFIYNLAEREGWQVAGQYGEPGYGNLNTSLIILGNFWRRVDGQLKDYFHKYPRIGRQLEAQGVELEWEDEWVVDYNYDKAYRCQPDSYSWAPSFAFTEDGEILTPDDDIEAWIDYARNNVRVAITTRQVPKVESLLEAAGWTRRPEDGDFASGWHPGQTDDPKVIDAELRAEHGDIDVLFVVTGVGQFDIHFAAFFKACE